MDDWYRWVMGGLVAAYSAVTGFLVGFVLYDRKKIAELDLRLAVVENREHVDPIENARTLTKIDHQLESITKDRDEAAAERKEMLRLLRAMAVTKGVSR